jgi:virginiamycin A acetyltransferase
MAGPDPMEIHPLPAHPRVVFLKPLATSPNVEVGDYTYYDDPDDPEAFFRKNILYHYDFIGDRLVIGRFCAIAAGATFVMNGANHPMRGLSTYPFGIFPGWESTFDLDAAKDAVRGDTVVGNDVWVGYGATILPGVKIGDGAIIGAQAVVASDVPAYGIALGNPARTVRRRFDDPTVDRLLAVAWWNWDPDKIARNNAVIESGDIEALEAAA